MSRHDPVPPQHRYVRTFSAPDEVIELDKVRAERIDMGGMVISHDIQEPGWRWSVHIKPRVGTEWCQTHHVGVILHGRLHALMADGIEFEMGPMDVIDLPPGHDAWVIGDEAVETLSWVGGSWLTPVDVDRMVATVLFTDIVSSTAVGAAMGDRQWRDTREEHDQRVREQLGQFRGTEVNTTGDGFFSLFDSPTRAVRCAQGIVRSIRALGIEVRVGLHTGEVEQSPSDTHGVGVVIGARIGALAGPSEILVSQTVKDLTTGSGLGYEDAGEYELKGVPGRWRVHRVLG